jgi:hypothetical protein
MTCTRKTCRAARRNASAKPRPGITPKGKFMRPPLVGFKSQRGETHCQRPGRRVREGLS